MITTVPAGWVANGLRTRVCVRHGLPVVRTRTAAIESSPAGWTWALLPLTGGLIFIIVRAATRMTVNAPAWGFCGRCGQRRNAFLAAGIAVMLGSVGGVIGALSAELADETTGFLVAVLTATFIAGIVLIGRASWASVAHARVLRKGFLIEFRKPAAAFAAEVDAALAAAATWPRPAAPAPAPASAPVGPWSAPR